MASCGVAFWLHWLIPNGDPAALWSLGRRKTHPTTLKIHIVSHHLSRIRNFRVHIYIYIIYILYTHTHIYIYMHIYIHITQRFAIRRRTASLSVVRMSPESPHLWKNFYWFLEIRIRVQNVIYFLEQMQCRSNKVVSLSLCLFLHTFICISTYNYYVYIIYVLYYTCICKCVCICICTNIIT